jgi:CcmD family protein
MSERIALWFMFFAYTAVFLILFGFVTRTYRQAQRLTEELERLKEAMREGRGSP